MDMDHVSTGLFLKVKHNRFVRDVSGQTMVEYVLTVLLLALVVIIAIPAVATGISGAFDKIAREAFP